MGTEFQYQVLYFFYVYNLNHENYKLFVIFVINVLYRHEVQLKAVGGDGSYIWQSDGSALVDSYNGLVTAIGPGKAKITASMPSNPNIFGTAKWVKNISDHRLIQTFNSFFFSF